MVNEAFVKIWGMRAGAVVWDAERRLALFEYDPKFLKTQINLAPLTMPLANAGNRVFSFPELRNNDTFAGLPGLLADVLPDKFGNDLINAWLARSGRPANSMNPVERLCYIGSRGIGALEFEPTLSDIKTSSTKIDLEQLVDLAQNILNERSSWQGTLKGGEEKTLLDLIKIGTSAGGARAKAVIAYHPTTKEVRSGQGNVPEGFEHWLIKFDGVNDAQLGTSSGYGRVEMAYSLMATSCGILMSPCKLLEEGERAHFMTKRFDRNTESGKVHMQSLCAMAHYDFQQVSIYAYEQLFEVMRSLYLPYSAAEQMFRRMVFNVMAKNCDDHTKNHAFVLPKGGVWQLSPAFDLCHAFRPGSNWVSQQSLSVNGKRSGIKRHDFMEVAKAMNIKKAKQAIDEVAEACALWPKFAKQTEVPTKLTKAIQSTFESID
jgi:serine/threonine-protein kinase HipA